MARIKNNTLRRICLLLIAGARKGLLPSGLAFGLAGLLASDLSAERPTTTCYTPMPTNYGPRVTKTIAYPNPPGGANVIRVVATFVEYDNNRIVARAEAYGDFSDYQSIPMKPADGEFDSDSEDVDIDLNVSGWTDGIYAIYVRGYNDLGEWSPSGAVNVEISGGE